ncbi:MAG: aspartate--tRNA ligase [Mesoaciditoga sp.]|uniref:aspartate--tRNA ligase n=1 Tax=Athalassotoga sp. TaxID=2022597 RepID=UPI000CABA5AF|nr:MAG: aspartate--tRNA ligase [Mesoaciditoga sp.]PMP80872.1 MAG: aspartate--tRNA ligase [Mesoaciditoga sp.]HEU23990.1 aspartate--tRNA ligase [Mesoaciditoga lauensis]
MLKRTHRIHELNDSLKGKEVIINGWVDRVRDLGGIIFVWVRDRYGIIQVLFEPGSHAYEIAKKLSVEYVIGVKGTLRERPKDAKNLDLASGDLEILAIDLEILAESKTPPIYINREEGSEDIRLKYRYLDLRRKSLQSNLIFRHKLMQKTREYFNSLDFVEIETPYLMKSTPEGARNFIVPSRIKKGTFYALPQSPQIFKQLLMIAGFDRYYQIARCFRDEDLRADRQPEFTQIDVEMSFVDQEDVQKVIGDLVKYLFKETLNIDIGDVSSMKYSDAMELYGSDKPDLRFGMEMRNLKDKISTDNLGFLKPSEKEEVKMMIVPPNEVLSRKDLDGYTENAKSSNLKLGWAKFVDGKFTGGIGKLLAGVDLGVKSGETVLICTGERNNLNSFLGRVRIDIANKIKIIPDKTFKVLWINEFPMFEWNEEEQRFQAQHHPFTMPYLEDLENEDLSKIRAHSYDLVINGWEMGSGSVRIHTRPLQEKIFKLIGISEEEAKRRFGFFLEAFEYGAPPHAGFAIGVDRLVSIMVGASSLREVIAFPKTTSGTDLMMDTPSEVTEEQLKELGIRLEGNS